MPRNKVLEKAKVSMPSGRNAFDLSQEKAFTSLCGEIGVCYAQPFVAGTKGKISRKCFTRTADVVAPAFHRVTEHFDFFVVPIHSLWRSWENWKTHINDMQDTNLVPWNSITGQGDLTLPSSAPRMNFIDLVNRIWYQTPTGTQVAQFCREINDMLNLCDELRMCDDFPADSSSGVSKVLNLLMLGAYHKCYYDHYRNTAYESNNPYAYNFDWLYDGIHNGLLDPIAPTGGGSPSKDNLVASMLFKRHRVNYRNDYFHNIYPALNYVSSQPAGLTFRVPDGIGQLLVGSTASTAQRGTVGAFGSVVSSNPTARGGANAEGYTSQINTVGVSVQSIRAAFALDKLMRASAYAPKHVRDQYKAQFGVDGVEDFDMRSERIGSFQNEVQFTEVTNMAHTTLGQLGDLGAKGLGGDQNAKPIDFYCRYDSIVIGLHYFLPRARYDNHGIHPWNIKVFQDDFYQKAFENLGLRPFYLYNFDGTQTQQIGWSVPNFEYKILPDLNLGCFRETYTSYEVQFDASGTPSINRLVHLGSQLSPFVPHTMNNNWAYYGTAEYFKVAPEDLDSVFAVKVPVDHARDFFQFYGDYRIMCAIVAPMSVHGQPSL